VQAVSAVSLRVPVGERRALIGPNGAGKTTLFSVIAGEYRADQGAIALFDSDITHASVQQRAKRGLGRTYQISQLFLQLTVEQNLFLAAAASKNLEFNLFGRWQKHNEARTWVREVAEQVHLHDYLNARVDELSHGLQRQLEVGMAIAPRPRLIMLDEPAAGLSPSERTVLTRLIGELGRDLTLILIEHDMEIVLEIADQITVLHRGAVIAEGSPGEIRANSEVQQVYLGNTYS
jgi:branched-chain amino acid transport system ATP-binding protein